MSDALRLGLVGCGRLAELGYAPAARRTPSVEFVAVADPDRTRRGVLAAKLGVQGHARLSELLTATPVDGLVVCTPVEGHEEVAALAARSGVTALVEKPPAADAAGALRIAALQPSPWVAFNRRFDQGLQLVGKVPPDGDLTIGMVLNYRRSSWRPVQRGDDALLDLAPHLIDLALFLTRSLPLAVRADATRERAGLVLAMSRAEVHIACATDRPHHELIEIHGADGRLAGRAVSAGRVRGALARLRPGAHPLVRSLAQQLEAYARALRGADPGPLATAAEGAAVMRVLDAARRSDAIGGDAVAVEGVTVTS